MLLEGARHEGASLLQRLRRPEVEWSDIVGLLPELASASAEAAAGAVIDARYAGYVARQAAEVARNERWAAKRIPASFDYAGIQHLRAEAREKLGRIRPVDLSQASRVSGITPADIALVMMHLEGKHLPR